MMILSRFWYAFLGLVVGFALYALFLAVGQYNRSNYGAMKEILASDLRVVRKELQIDARRRIDVLLPAAVDKSVQESLNQANGKDRIPQKTRDDARKAAESVQKAIQEDLRPDGLFLVDRDGRVVGFAMGKLGFPPPQDEFGLGGYPSVNDALHGFLRDDTWMIGGQIYRVAARPVEFDSSQPPVGAVVALRQIDNSYAKRLSEVSRASVVFLAQGKQVAGAAGETFDETKLPLVAKGLAKVEADPEFKNKGLSSFVPVGESDAREAALYGKLDGETWGLRAAFAVVRSPIVIDGPLGFLKDADDTDKKSVPWLIIAGVVVVALLVGVLLSFIEHTLPLRTVAREAKRLKDGGVDLLPLAAFKSGYRSIADDLNRGIERVAEKGGGAPRKQADLEAILGPMPVKPAMSAFSLPGEPSGRDLPPVASAPASNRGAPPKLPAPVPAKGLVGMPPPVAKAPPGFPGLATNDVPAAHAPILGEEDDTTRVGNLSRDDIRNASSPHAVTPEVNEWLAVYEDFVRTKKQCGEVTEGLTFEKFQHTLRKNRDALIERHGCKRVKFSVYIKEGKASLKATPVKE